MNVFASAESGGKDGKGANLALGYTYPPAAHLINLECGPTFVSASLSNAVSAGIASVTPPGVVALFSVAIGVLTLLT